MIRGLVALPALMLVSACGAGVHSLLTRTAGAIKYATAAAAAEAVACGKATARYGDGNWADQVRPVVDCALKAQNEGKPFVAEIVLLGVDTLSDTIFSRDAQGLTWALWDSKAASLDETCVGRKLCSKLSEDFVHADGTNPSGLLCEDSKDEAPACQQAPRP